MQQDQIVRERETIAQSPGPSTSLAELNWRVALRAAARGLSNHRWRIGDLLLEGEAAGFESYPEAVEATGLTAGTLANLKSLARQFPASRRREGLSWSHHAEVASASHERADRMLDAAIAGGWTVKELREKLRPPPISYTTTLIERPVVVERAVPLERVVLAVEHRQVEIAEIRAKTFAPAEKPPEAPQQYPPGSASYEALAAAHAEVSAVLERYGGGLDPETARHFRAGLRSAELWMMRLHGTAAAKH